jgi:tetratricopeptide (TPR) repeat protein
MMRVIVCGLAFGVATVASAQDTPLERCTTLSFAPLEVNVPACTALIQNGGRDEATLASIYAARAEAYEFAIVYHGDREVNASELLALALADLDRAVAADPGHHQSRGDILFRLSRFAEAAESYTAAIDATPANARGLLQLRSMALAEVGDRSGAIDDMTATIRLTTRPYDRARLLVRRAELREAAGDIAGAIADYEEVTRLSPGNRSAGEALARLSGARR